MRARSVYRASRSRFPTRPLQRSFLLRRVSARGFSRDRGRVGCELSGTQPPSSVYYEAETTASSGRAPGLALFETWVGTRTAYGGSGADEKTVLDGVGQ